MWNSLKEILTNKTSVDILAVQSLSIATDTVITLRHPEFFEVGDLGEIFMKIRKVFRNRKKTKTNKLLFQFF